jgi:hypothetical protein
MGEFHLQHIGTNEMPADGFTKGLNFVKHREFLNLIHLTRAPKGL